MNLTISRDDIKEYEKLNIISQMTPIKEKIRLFEIKYECSLEEFESGLKGKEENFEEWDDYIEWKSYLETATDLEQRLRAIPNVKNIKIT